MIRHRDRLESLRTLIGSNANQNHNALYRLRRLAYKGRMKQAPPITQNSPCECSEFLRVPCPAHPNYLNWSVNFSGCIGGQYATRTIRYSSAIKVGENVFGPLRRYSEIVRPAGPYVPGYWKYIGPYAPVIYLKIFGGALSLPAGDKMLDWDTETAAEKEKYDIPLLDYIAPTSDSPVGQSKISYAPLYALATRTYVSLVIDSVSPDGNTLVIQGHEAPDPLSSSAVTSSSSPSDAPASDPFMGIDWNTAPDLDFFSLD